MPLSLLQDLQVLVSAVSVQKACDTSAQPRCPAPYRPLSHSVLVETGWTAVSHVHAGTHGLKYSPTVMRLFCSLFFSLVTNHSSGAGISMGKYTLLPVSV